MTDRSAFFVSTEDLAAALGAPDLVVVDASWYLPAMKRDAAAEYAAARIPGAVRFDLDAIADHATTLPHMLPSPEAFAAAVGALGITETSRIVVYDGAGLFSAPRVWWTFRLFGATDVRILDGGLPKWKAEGRPLDTVPPAAPAPRLFRPAFDAPRVVDLASVAAILADGSATVVDARPGERFRGEAAEPRPGVRAGHMPGARSVPAASVVADGRLADERALRAAFAGVDTDRPLVTSCGSGVTAAILWLALETLGVPRDRLALYDGSWSEWGAAEGTPVVTGE
ncbi:3-mercaptopyruvate sulfurtransferase [Siculibacillus lacustris]|uniref:3-mercaptopyruvate sulfurtransferase n=1 Tax=Siculibacillus lacustris TaxID=1549641 RepID=A0A4Q9VGK7_9HYPH|nr:3-mercaptopyruvate sulfurtransferase [Siculibacillus lacustris]TBW33631.1 3-mercaptopyruvate sulfurtransferase [Siculibacillus lacustris]